MNHADRFRHGSRVRRPAARRAEPAAVTEANEIDARQLLEALPVAGYTCDVEGHITLFNQAAVDLWGRTPEPGKDLWCGALRLLTVDGASLAPGSCPMAIALTEGRVVGGEEIVIERPDGSRRHVKMYPQPLRDGRGHVTGAVNMLVDLTEQRRHSLELADVRDDLRSRVAGMDAMHDLSMQLAHPLEIATSLEAVLETLTRIHRADRGLILLHNPATGRLEIAASVGFDADAAEQFSLLASHAQGPDATAFATRARVIIADAEQDVGVERFQRVARALGVRAAHSTPIVNRDGDILGVISVHFDTPRHPSLSEKQFADMCARYAASAIESARTQQALRIADRRKDEFLATLAHELRNPLAPLRNSLQILRLSERQEHAPIHAMMDRQLDHLVRLVDDLMEVSRITRGRIDLKRERVLLATILRGAVETTQPLVDAAGHRLHIELPDEPVILDADAVRLVQVFANLLSNAAKYTEPGGEIWLSAQVDQDRVRVSVRDTGIGIARDVLPRIFDLFIQEEQAPRQPRASLGIGLTIVRHLVEMHGGTVTARSAGVRRGSEFVVVLPAVAARDESEIMGAPAARGSGQLEGYKMLVVDDSRDGADSLVLILEMLGAEVRVAYDGPSALEILNDYHPSVMLLDIGLPGMDGYELARRVRERPAGRQARLIALTGWGQAEDRERSAAAGFDRHLVKPLDINELMTVLDRNPVRVPQDQSANPASTTSRAGSH